MTKYWICSTQALQQAEAEGQNVAVRGTNIPQGLGSFAYSELGNLRPQLRSILGSISSVEFPAVVFEPTYPNANYVRFRDEDLEQLAKSFTNQPFLKDHNQRQLDSRIGTIRSSELNDNSQIVEHVELTSREGIEAFIEGRIDRFSIGWEADEVNCSLCDDSIWNCSHWPGLQYDEGLCEILFLEPLGVETSAVNVPAVQGTQVLAVITQEKADMANNPLGMSRSEVKAAKRQGALNKVAASEVQPEVEEIEEPVLETEVVVEVLADEQEVEVELQTLDSEEVVTELSDDAQQDEFSLLSESLGLTAIANTLEQLTTVIETLNERINGLEQENKRLSQSSFGVPNESAFGVPNEPPQYIRGLSTRLSRLTAPTGPTEETEEVESPQAVLHKQETAARLKRPEIKRGAFDRANRLSKILERSS